MKTYARYTANFGINTKILGNGWHEVTAEYSKRFPSGTHTVIVIGGIAVKARHCEIVQVFA